MIRTLFFFLCLSSSLHAYDCLAPEELFENAEGAECIEIGFPDDPLIDHEGGFVQMQHITFETGEFSGYFLFFPLDCKEVVGGTPPDIGYKKLSRRLLQSVENDRNWKIESVAVDDARDLSRGDYRTHFRFKIPGTGMGYGTFILTEKSYYTLVTVNLSKKYYKKFLKTFNVQPSDSESISYEKSPKKSLFRYDKGR